MQGGAFVLRPFCPPRSTIINGGTHESRPTNVFGGDVVGQNLCVLPPGKRIKKSTSCLKKTGCACFLKSVWEADGTSGRHGVCGRKEFLIDAKQSVQVVGTFGIIHRFLIQSIHLFHRFCVLL